MTEQRKNIYRFTTLGIICIAVFALALVFGSIKIPLASILDLILGKTVSDRSWELIFFESRLPRAVTAAAGAAGLALSGLLMQTLFRNPLAGPSVLGISSGASLGVSVLVMGAGGMSVVNDWSIALAATAGALLVLFVIIAASVRLNDSVSLLIFGMMLSYVAGAVVSVMQYKSSLESLRGFVLWGLGSFGETSWYSLGIMSLVFVVGIILCLFILPALNLLLLGEDYASTMGLNVRRTRFLMILITGLLAGTITAFCGPVAFVGLAVPHIARMMFKTSNHKIILPATVAAGAITGMFCDLIARLAGIPLNAVTAALGAPLVIYIVFRGSSSRPLI